MLSISLIFLFIIRISANPVPQSTTDLSPDVSFDEKFDGASTFFDADIANDPDCGADETTSSNSNINKRDPASCPAKGMTSSVGRGSWRAPTTLPQINPKESDPGNERSREFCPLPFMQVLLSCSSPEVVYNSAIIGYVLNCVPGKFRFRFGSHSKLIPRWLTGSVNRIEARKPFPAIEGLNQYCCHKFFNTVSFLMRKEVAPRKCVSNELIETSLPWVLLSASRFRNHLSQKDVAGHLF